MNINSRIYIAILLLYTCTLISAQTDTWARGKLIVNSPVNITGEYDVSGSLLGSTPMKPITGLSVYVGTACSAISHDLNNKIALVDRGTCDFLDKYNNIIARPGVLAIVMINTIGETLWAIEGGSDPSKAPLVLVGKSVGLKFKDYNYQCNITIPFESCSGTKVITDSSGVVQSQYIAALTAPNMDCTFILEPSNNQAVELGFEYIALAGTHTVIVDGWNGINWVQKWLYGSPKTGSIYQMAVEKQNGVEYIPEGFVDKKIRIRIKTDSSTANRGRGFLARYSTCPKNNVFYLEKSEGWISSDPVSVSAQNGNCTWVISAGVLQTPVQLFFNQWNEPMKLPGAKLIFRDGTNSSAPILVEYGGGTNYNLEGFVPHPVVSSTTSSATGTTGALHIELVLPDSILSNPLMQGIVPFTALFTAGRCPQLGPAIASSYRATFSDGSGPLTNYEFYLNCWWYYIAPEDAPVTVKWNRFATESQYDFVNMFDLNKMNGNGVDLAHRYRPPSSGPYKSVLSALDGTRTGSMWNSPGPFIGMQFTSDGGGALRGWNAEIITGYCAVNVTDGLKLDHPVGVIVNASHSSNLNVSLCAWRIERADSGIMIYIQGLVLGSDKKNRLRIYEGSQQQQQKMVFEKDSDTTFPSPVAVNSKSALIVSESLSGEAHPPDLKFSMVYQAGACHGFPVSLLSTEGQFSDGSPKGKNYLKNQDCVFEIAPKVTGGIVRVIQVNFTSFALFDDDYLRHDCLSSRQSIEDSNSDPGTITGSSYRSGSNLLFFCQTVKLTFHSSSSSTPKDGFQALYAVSSDCPAGYWVNGTTMSNSVHPTCVKCGVGEYSNGGTIQQCTKCSPGFFADKEGTGSCTKCESGSYATGYGNTKCDKCPAGQVPNSVQDGCSKCVSGHYTSQSGASICSKCSAGTYTSGLASTACSPCDIFSYNPLEGQSKCTQCASNEWVGASGKTKATECTCLKDFYRAATGCYPCPTGATCAGGSESPLPKPGFFKAADGTFMLCSPPSACSGLTVGLSANISQCHRNYTGLLCGKCAPNFHQRDDKVCIACPSFEAAWLMFALICIVPFVFAAIALRSAKTRFKAGSLAVMIEFVQVMAVLTTYRLNWPREIELLSTILSFINFNLDIFSIDCALPSLHGNYWGQWAMFLALPGVMLVALVIMFAVHVLIIRIRSYSNGESIQRIDDDQALSTSIFKLDSRNLRFFYTNAFWLCLSLLHTRLSQAALDPLRCSLNLDGHYYLDGAPIRCYEGEWLSVLPWIITSIVIYVIGIPASMLYLLGRNKHRLNTAKFQNQYSSIFLVYDESRWYWNSVVKVMKLAIVLPLVVLAGKELWQWAITMVLLFAVFVIITRIRPHRFLLSNRLAYSTNMVQTVTFFCGILFFKGDLSQNERQGLNIFLGILSALVLIVLVFGTVMEMMTYHRRKYIGSLASRFPFIQKLTAMRELLPFEMEMATFARDKYTIKSGGGVVSPAELSRVFGTTLRLVDASMFLDWVNQASEGEQINAHGFLKSIHYYLWVKPGVLKAQYGRESRADVTEAPQLAAGSSASARGVSFSTAIPPTVSSSTEKKQRDDQLDEFISDRHSSRSRAQSGDQMVAQAMLAISRSDSRVKNDDDEGDEQHPSGTPTASTADTGASAIPPPLTPSSRRV